MSKLFSSERVGSLCKRNSNFLFLGAMKFLLSGAWGYGNIGDDAILEATLPLIKKVDSKADITCVTYDLKFTSEAGISFDHPLELSMHRALSGTEGFWFMTTKNHAVSCYEWPKIPQRLFQRFLKPICQKISENIDKRKTKGAYDKLEQLFRDADVFLMSGGGYFNTWPKQFDARIKELELAHRFNCKVVLFGQSIGPFTEKQKTILKRTILPSDIFCVRDPESVQEIEQLGFASSLAPDLAMGTSHRVIIQKGLLTVCPAEIRPEQEQVLSIHIANLVRIYGYRVRLILTRWIDPDVASMHRLDSKLHALGITNVEMIYPKTYPELVKAIEGSEWMLSRGLHAMILAWRAGTRVFALTKSRKVDGFLQAIHSLENQCKESDWENLTSVFAERSKQKQEWDEKLHVEITEKIEREFVDSFKKVGLCV